VGDIDFEVISAAENSNKFQKTRFWKEISVEDVVRVECLPFNSSRRNFDVMQPCKTLLIDTQEIRKIRKKEKKEKGEFTGRQVSSN